MGDARVGLYDLMSSLWRNPDGSLLPGSSGQALCRVATYPCDCDDPAVNPVPSSFPEWTTIIVEEDFPVNDLMYSFNLAWLFQNHVFSDDFCTTQNGQLEYRLNPDATVTALLGWATPRWTGTAPLERRLWNRGLGTWDPWVVINASVNVDLRWVSGTPDKWRMSISGTGGRTAEKTTGKTPVGTNWVGDIDTDGCQDGAIGGSTNYLTTAAVVS